MIQNEGSCLCRGFSLGLHHSRLPGTRGQVSETRFSQSQPSSSWLGGSQHRRFGDGACFQHGTASDASAAPDRPRAKCEESSRTAADPMRPQGRDPHASLHSQPEDAQRLLFLQLPPLHSGEGPARACFQITAIFNPFSYPSPSGVLRGPARFPSPPPVLRSDRGTQCSPDTFPAHYTGHLKPFRTKCSRALR